MGDVGRVEIQHDLMKTLAEQAISLENLGKVKELVSIVEESITSDLDYGEMLWMGEKVLGMDRENIHFYDLPGDFTGTIWSPHLSELPVLCIFVNPTAPAGHCERTPEPIWSPSSTEQHVIHGTHVVNEPSLPPSTGLPILQPGEYTGNGWRPPRRGIQVRGLALRRARSQTTEGQDGKSHKPGDSLRSAERPGPGNPGTTDRESPPRSETPWTPTRNRRQNLRLSQPRSPRRNHLGLPHRHRNPEPEPAPPRR